MKNLVILIGRVGQDPTSRVFENGTTVASLTLATSEKWKDKNTGEMKEDTVWHNLTFWREKANLVSRYVKKGDLIYIEGKIRNRSWEKDGVKHYATDIHVDTVQFLTPKGSAQPATTPSAQAIQHEPIDELPF